MLAIEHRPPHLYECLWCHHYVRKRNIVTILSLVYLSYLRVVATRHEPSSLWTTRYGSGVLDMYVVFLQPVMFENYFKLHSPWGGCRVVDKEEGLEMRTARAVPLYGAPGAFSPGKFLKRISSGIWFPAFWGQVSQTTPRSSTPETLYINPSSPKGSCNFWQESKPSKNAFLLLIT